MGCPACWLTWCRIVFSGTCVYACTRACVRACVCACACVCLLPGSAWQSAGQYARGVATMRLPASWKFLKVLGGGRVPLAASVVAISESCLIQWFVKNLFSKGLAR